LKPIQGPMEEIRTLGGLIEPIQGSMEEIRTLGGLIGRDCRNAQELSPPDGLSSSFIPVRRG